MQPLSFVYGNCLMGACGAWALFRLEPFSYVNLAAESKLDKFSRLVLAIEAISADIQVLRIGRPSDSVTHAAELERKYEGPHSAAHRDYVRAQAAMHEDDANDPAVFLAVSLEPPKRDVAGFVAALAERRTRDVAPSIRERLHWGRSRMLSARSLERLRVGADEAHARISTFVSARPARAPEVQWLVRRCFCRGVGEPYVDGLQVPQALVFECNGAAQIAPLEADVIRWCDSSVEIHGRALRIDSELGTSWQAHLITGALPDRAVFPGARVEVMFAPAESLPFPVDLSLTGRFLPNDLATRLVRRRVQDADEIARAEAVGDQGVSDRGYDRTQDARDLLSYLQTASRPPLLRSALAVAVAATDREELERRVDACRRAFGEVQLHRPFGEQLQLFLQHLPGQRSRVSGYEGVLTPSQVAAMMPAATHAVGSHTGFRLGHTLTGSSHTVLFNPREGSDNNGNTAILSVGALGSGKTTLSQKLAYEAFLLGARIVDCDPKGDHYLHLLADVEPFVDTITLRDSSSLRGVLDPLRVAPAHMRQDAAVSFLCDLLPRRSESSCEAAVLKAVDSVLRRTSVPSSGEVIRALMAGDPVERDVAKTLAVYASRGVTQLGFAEPGQRLPVVGEKQVTYLLIRDLPTPQPGRTKTEYTALERVSEQMVRLIAMFAMQLVAAERSKLKVFVFDEGWRLLGDPVGRTLLGSLQRMGRSELAVPIVSTQLVSDTLVDEAQTLEALAGATFVFGLRSDREAQRALRLLGLEPSDRALRASLLAFERGRCLMRDHRGRVEAVQVELVPRLLRAWAAARVQ